MPWVDLCKRSELIEGEGRYVDLGKYRLALFLKGGELYACDDACPHAGGSMSSGTIDNGFITCPWHYWSFKLTDGRMVSGGRARLRFYPTRIVGEAEQAVIQADLPPQE